MNARHTIYTHDKYVDIKRKIYIKGCIKYIQFMCMQHTVLYTTSKYVNNLLNSFAEFASLLSSRLNPYIYHKLFPIWTMRKKNTAPCLEPPTPHHETGGSPLESPGRPFASPDSDSPRSQLRKPILKYISMICLYTWIDFNISLYILTYFHLIMKNFWLVVSINIVGLFPR